MTEKPFCFVIAPIGEKGSAERKQSDVALRYIIEPALTGTYDVKRADADSRPGEITKQMIQDINRANLIVCNLSGLNANVMYELGIAHCLGKQVIHLFDRQTSLPFDVRQSRSIVFDIDDPESHSEASRELKKFESSLKDKSIVSNPFVDAMAGPLRLSDEELKDKTITSLLADNEELLSRIEGIERLLKVGVPDRRRYSSEKAQVDAAAKLIDILESRAGYEKVLFDTIDGKRCIIVLGSRDLELANLPVEVDGVSVQYRIS